MWPRNDSRRKASSAAGIAGAAQPQVLGPRAKALAHLGGELLEELLAIGRVGQHRDREVEAREGGEPTGDAKELLGQLQALAEEIEGEQLVARMPDPVDPEGLVDREQPEDGEEEADREADDQDLN